MAAHSCTHLINIINIFSIPQSMVLVPHLCLSEIKSSLVCVCVSECICVYVLLTMLQCPWAQVGVGGVVHLLSLLRGDRKRQENWRQEAEVVAGDAHVVVAEQRWPVGVRETA